jgi:plastocyanin
MDLNRFGPLAAVLCVLTAACGGSQPAPASQPAPGAKRVDEAKAANVAGRVLIEGPVPVNPAIKMAADPFCIRENKDGRTFENFVVSDGGLENVFVWVKDGLGNYAFDVPTEPVKVDQQGCRYHPHVVGVRAGQPIEISNSDDTLHNINARAEINQPFNIGQSQAGLKNTVTFTAQEVMIMLKCDVHSWMNAYAGVVNHPYFAVTADGGKFELKNLPAGTYTIEAWHEKLGTQTQTVTVADNESKAITFTFTSPAATN